jgi:RNA polymerase sigma-70 factor (ECF subfamily)
MVPQQDADDLIESARAGSAEALNELFGLYRAQLRHEAGIRLEGALGAKLDGSDAAQSVLLRATERFDQFRGESAGEFAAWLRTILTNHLRDENRRYLGDSRSIHREVRIQDLKWFDDECADLLVETDSDEITRRETSLKVAKVLESLPRKTRDLLVWRSFEHLEWSEVAERLRTTPDAARMRWSRALILLGLRLREQ